jgi:flagellar motor switch/type III secretory pathway protein FliN
VVAELGRITLRGEELLGLAPGAVLRLAAGRRTVSLRAGGELWAEGEIVDVEGELGVRVTRVLSR